MRWNSALCKPSAKSCASPQQEYLRPTFSYCTPFTFSFLPLLLPSEHATKHSSSGPLFPSVDHRPRMRPPGDALLKRWHRMLGLSRQSPPCWYRDRLREELREYRLAKTPCQKISEASDVFFSALRAQYDGFPVRRLPSFAPSRHVLVYAYMLAKFTLRWGFYRIAAIICNAPRYDLVREVVNPSKDEKLEEVASRHQIDPVKFKRVGRLLRQIWPLLP